jgi:DNA mismatch repair protein MutS2
MDQQTLKALEFDALIELLASRAKTPLGRARAIELRPSADRNQIVRALERTAECADYLASGGSFDLSEIVDPGEILAKLRIEGSKLEPNQMVALERLIAAALNLRAQFKDEAGRYPQLASIAATVPDMRQLISRIRRAILPGGEISDDASPELSQIRRQISEARSRIYRKLERIMREHQSAIQEEIITIRNGRFVIPVRTDSRGLIQGVMHGLSSTGHTTFIEPLSVIDQNNEIVRLREQEEIEIARILLELTESLRANLPGIEAACNAISEIDLVGAKARLALEFRCSRPQLSEDGLLRLKAARHLLLENALRGRRHVVPISLQMDPQHRVMIISGPNAGGKTVALKTIGLTALMAQMGMYVPADEAALPAFDQIFADIGDQQSIAADLSTFTAHMRNISEMAARVRPPALVLIDEVGTGTDPDQGAALAVAIVDYFRRAGATTIATTHYNRLKIWASQSEGVLNASVEFDERTLRPTYRLIVGVAGSSFGLEIAERMNVPPEITAQARLLLDPSHWLASDYLKRLKALLDQQEALLAALEEERRAVAEKYSKLEAEFARREAERQAEFNRELSRLIEEFRSESERLIGALSDKVVQARLRKEAAARASGLARKAARLLKVDQANQPQPAVQAHNIRERDRVLVKPIGREGTVESISGDLFTVLIGSLRFRAARHELELIESAKQPAGGLALPEGMSADISIDENFSSELNVIGMAPDEAVARVDKFLDEAFLVGADSVRIVHGYGKGALRRAIAELLAGHPHVKSFQQAGSGATVVQLRR